MSYTTVQICNLALARVGDDAAQITSLTDGSNEAALCSKFYEPTLRELLSMHTWNFSKSYGELSASTTDPTFGWDYSYPLPADCIRPLELRSHSSSDPLKILDEWKVVGRNIYTNVGEAYLIYDSYVTDPNLMTPLFVRALYTGLASKLAYPLTEDRQLVAALENELSQVIMPEAKRVNAFEGYEFPTVDSEWIQASFSSDFNNGLRGFAQENYGTL
jgi:hypothetical protein